MEELWGVDTYTHMPTEVKEWSIAKVIQSKAKYSSQHTVLSLINAPGALQFFKRGMFIRGKSSMQKCSV